MKPISELIFTTLQFTLLYAMKELYTRIIQVVWEVQVHAKSVGGVGEVVCTLLCFHSKVGAIVSGLWKPNSVTKITYGVLCSGHFLHQTDPVLLEC